MVLYAYVCVCAFSLHQESPGRILGDKPLLVQGGFCHTQYGAHHVDTDVKKTAMFCKGLCAKIHEQLMSFQSWTFNLLMSGTIRQEDAICAMKEERKGKRAAPGPSGGALSKYRLVYTPPAGQPHGPPPQQQ
jgi:hypothetical protein